MISKLADYQQVKANDLNRVIDAVNRVSDITAAPPLEVVRNAGRVQLRYTEKGFMGAITARSSSSSSSGSSGSGSGSSGTSATYTYTVQEIQPTSGGEWEFISGGRVLSAHEWNDARVAVNAVVWVEPFSDNDWRFEHCCQASSSSSSSSSSSVDVGTDCRGAFVGVTSDACFTASISTAHGACACIDTTQEAVTLYSAGSGIWIGDGTEFLYTCSGTSFVPKLDLSDPCCSPKLTLVAHGSSGSSGSSGSGSGGSDYVMRPTSCGTGYARFAGGGTTECGSAALTRVCGDCPTGTAQSWRFCYVQHGLESGVGICSALNGWWHVSNNSASGCLWSGEGPEPTFIGTAQLVISGSAATLSIVGTGQEWSTSDFHCSDTTVVLTKTDDGTCTATPTTITLLADPASACGDNTFVVTVACTDCAPPLPACYATGTCLTNACPDRPVLPGTLYLCIEDLIGNCGCLGGTYALEYNTLAGVAGVVMNGWEIYLPADFCNYDFTPKVEPIYLWFGCQTSLGGTHAVFAVYMAIWRSALYQGGFITSEKTLDTCDPVSWTNTLSGTIIVNNSIYEGGDFICGIRPDGHYPFSLRFTISESPISCVSSSLSSSSASGSGSSGSASSASSGSGSSGSGSSAGSSSGSSSSAGSTPSLPSLSSGGSISPSSGSSLSSGSASSGSASSGSCGSGSSSPGPCAPCSPITGISAHTERGCCGCTCIQNILNLNRPDGVQEGIAYNPASFQWESGDLLRLFRCSGTAWQFSCNGGSSWVNASCIQCGTGAGFIVDFPVTLCSGFAFGTWQVVGS